MRVRILLLLIVLQTFNFLYSDDDLMNKSAENEDLQSVFNVMYALDTWGKAHFKELMKSEIEFVSKNVKNEYLFILLENLSKNLSWQNFREFSKLTSIETSEFSKWNRRYYEDLMLKYYYFDKNTQKINEISNKRYFPRDYYVVGPLKKSWNHLLRTQWSYLFDPNFEFSTPFGVKKYNKVQNVPYIENMLHENVYMSSDEVDYYKTTYLYAFSANFETDAKIILKTNLSSDEIYVNGTPLNNVCSKSIPEDIRVIPSSVTAGRYDFVIQSQEPLTKLNIEFISIDESELKVSFNSNFNNDYGRFSLNFGNHRETRLCKHLSNYVYSNQLNLKSGNSLDQLFWALNSVQDSVKYQNWYLLKTVFESNSNAILQYLFAKATSDMEILPANIKLKYTIPMYKELAENHPDFTLAKLGLYRSLYNQSEYAQALNILNEIIESDEKNIAAWKELSKFYNDRNWMAQDFTTTMKVAELFPEDFDAQFDKAWVLASHRNYAEANKLLGRLIVTIPAVEETYVLWKFYLDVLDTTELTFEAKNKIWQKCVELYAESTSDVKLDYSKFLENNGKYRDALEILLELYQTTPSFQLAKDVSELYFILNDNDQGIEYLRKSIMLNPEMKSAERQYLLNVSNSSDTEFYQKFTIPIDEVLKKKIDPKDYPSSASVVLLDEEVRRIFPDGSATSIVTTVRHILTSEGAEEFGSIQLFGELIKGQVIKANGEIIEPSVIGKTINFQGTEIGCTQIIVSQEIYDEFDVQFFFSDPEHREYFQDSRFIIVKHDDVKDFKIIERSIECRNKYKFQDYQVYEYEEFNSPPIPEQNEYDPGISDYLPNVVLAKKQNDPNNLHSLMLESEYKYQITSLIEEKVEVLMKGKTSEFERAESIYNFVANEIEYDFFVDNPSETLLNMTGNNTNLLMTMYQAADIKCELIKILTHNALQKLYLAKEFDNFYYADFIDGYRILIDNKWHYILRDDEVMKYISFRNFPYIGVIGFNFNEQVRFFTIDNTGNADQTLATTDFTLALNENGLTASGTVEFSLHDSNSMRSILEENSDTMSNSIMREFVNDMQRSMTIDELKIINKTGNSNLKIELTGKIQNSLHKIDENRIEVGMGLNPLNLIKTYTPTTDRKLNLKIRDDDFVERVDRRTFKTPEGYILQNVPTSAFFITKNFFYTLNIERTASHVTFERRWRTFPAEYTPEEYKKLKQYCEAIDELEKTPITLFKTK